MRTISLMIALVAAAPAAAQEATWIAPDAGDLAPTALVTAKAAVPPSVNTARDTVQFGYPVSGEPLAVDESVISESRAYWLDVTGAELESGIELQLTAPGALVRLSPADGRAAGPKLGQVSVESSGRMLVGSEAVERFVDGEQLKAAGLDVDAGTVAFRLSPSVYSNTIRLKTGSLGGDAKARWVVHVFEPNSPVVLRMVQERPQRLAGETVAWQVELDGAAKALDASELSGYLAGPAGEQSLPLHFSRDALGRVKAEVDTREVRPEAAGLFEARVFLEADGGTVLRDLTTAVGLAQPTARFSGEVALRHGGDALAVELGLEVAAAGRYEVSGVLVMLDGASEIPVAHLATAAWLEPGTGRLTLGASPEIMARVDGNLDLAIRQLALKDQSRMGMIWRQQRGPRISLAEIDDDR